jgi:N-acetylneuraminic acid mutarotase
MPGIRNSAASWIDSSGNFWMFAGDSLFDTDWLDDLWSYNPTTGLWAWVSGRPSDTSGVYGTLGIASAGNMPGSRQNASTWSDTAGNLWLFGGSGYDSVGPAFLLNDLWKYSLSTGLWTWVNGSNGEGASGVYGTQGVASASNVPGARSDASSWIDASGNLWLYGGIGMDSTGTSGDLNDLWTFRPATGQWTWVSGSNLQGAIGVYGRQNMAAARNAPGARQDAGSWIDCSGNLWLFGGFSPVGGNVPGASDVPAGTPSNDLWRFQPTTGQWTWVSGSNAPIASGVYGQQGTASATSIPGARGASATWIDSSGNLWLYGGNGLDSTGATGNLSDLWTFSPGSGQWTWVSGANLAGAVGVYGIQRIASSSNAPGAREFASSWIDAAGSLWLFGGDNYDESASPLSGHDFSDLWRWTPAQ